MKLARFLYRGRICSGTIHDDATVSVDPVYHAPVMAAVMLATRRTPSAHDAHPEPLARVPLAEVTLLAPVEPSKIICIATNYRAHALEMNRPIPDEPLIFEKPPTAVLAPGGGIEYPPSSEEVHHEAELAVIIGRPARDIGPEDAMRHVAGYTCFNDVTARDLQRKEANRFTRAKGFDTFAPIGPWLVTADALDPSDLAVTCHVNGVLRQEGRTADLIFSIRQCISFVSQVMTLEPGDIIATGTPSGVGPIRPGDTVSVTVEGIGTLKNPVVRRVGAPAWNSAR
jgi:2-keto-4-pentenoate hydratase/2-oxohepta-3-ene-1,7-dioic acid hydratase in catechol pathway